MGLNKTDRSHRRVFLDGRYEQGRSWNFQVYVEANNNYNYNSNNHYNYNNNHYNNNNNNNNYNNTGVKSWNW